MPRTKRIVPPNAALHIISRGNNRNNIFHSDNDKLRYYTLLCQLKDENKIDILHYCLMNNHVHIIQKVWPDSTLPKFMKQVNLTYFHYYSKKYGYSGHLWQDRFRSNIIAMDPYLLQCGKYVELNPVRAGITTHPSQCNFSSYNYYAQNKPDSLITPSPVFLGLSDTITSRQKQYADFVVDKGIVNSQVLEKKRCIGDHDFINRLQQKYKIINKREARGRPPKK